MTLSSEKRHGLAARAQVLERYIYITLSRRTQITLADRQYDLLRSESWRSGLSMAELVRRAIDAAYRQPRRPTVRGYELTLGVWRQPDAAVVGRLEPRRGRGALDAS